MRMKQLSVNKVGQHGPATAGGGFAAACCGPVIFTLVI